MDEVEEVSTPNFKRVKSYKSLKEIDENIIFCQMIKYFIIEKL